MSGKPAARVSDPTACPLPGHGTNPIAAGSGDVFFDGLAAARQGDASACGGAMVGDLATTVLINGKPAATVGSVGSHGNKVTAGSGTVIIGNSHSPAPFSGLAAIAVVAALDYRLGLKSGGNSVLTPLEIPDFDELKSGTSKNRELVDFVVENRMDAADSVKLEVLDGEKLVYAEANTAPFLPPGKYPWQWDGYDTAGILDTKVLKSPNLKVRLTATGVRTLRVRLPGPGGPAGIAELRFPGSPVTEALRVPTALADEARGLDLAHTGMAVVLHRTTADFPYRPPVARPDAEDAIDRIVTLPAARRFAVGGWASVNPAASDAALDRLAGIPAAWSFTSSGRLQEVPGRRASSAFDGRRSTAWIAPLVPHRRPGSPSVPRTRSRPGG